MKHYAKTVEQFDKSNVTPGTPDADGNESLTVHLTAVSGMAVDVVLDRTTWRALGLSLYLRKREDDRRIAARDAEA